MQMSPIIISIKTASAAIALTFLLGLFAARWIVKMKSEKIKMILDGILTLPLVLPPTVMGFLLLIVFGVNRPIGKLLLKFLGVKIVFSWTATVIAAVVISFPLMYRSARSAFEQIDQNLIMAARTLGMSERTIFWKVIMPLALPGVAGGGILAFARGLGEFGATAMIAGNIENKTRTLPLAIYAEVAAGNMKSASYYVIIVLLISFVVVVLTNYFSLKERKYFK
ncbi:molybdate ABC transporter permease subunit [Clostridium swellfunianum]|uniref:molybdate ABC transporter permease subunit n=1 Tax=Clostridium swellfunianum TaxID=1367462 RepID=UPI0020309990|nr:molybdate ABC transporter permease subunit [Clostridium swellfunianum]MCM0650522.1 molybdate ABC transporter permease subunit [Clostridium swellfunianum]